MPARPARGVTSNGVRKILHGGKSGKAEEVEISLGDWPKYFGTCTWMGHIKWSAGGAAALALRVMLN